MHAYFCKLHDGSIIYFLLEVDDMLIASKSKMKIKNLKTQSNQQFKMKELGETKKILSIEVCKDKIKGKFSLTYKDI